MSTPNDMLAEIATRTEYSIDDVQFQNCLRYLEMRDYVLTDGKPMTMENVALEFKVSPHTVYNWLAKWERSGMLSKIRDVLLLVRKALIEEAVSDVLAGWPDAIRNMLTIAKTGKGTPAVEAFRALNELVIRPAMRALDDEEQMERTYLGQKRSHNPMDIIEGTAKPISSD